MTTCHRCSSQRPRNDRACHRCVAAFPQTKRKREHLLPRPHNNWFCGRRVRPIVIRTSTLKRHMHCSSARRLTQAYPTEHAGVLTACRCLNRFSKRCPKRLYRAKTRRRTEAGRRFTSVDLRTDPRRSRTDVTGNGQKIGAAPALAAPGGTSCRTSKLAPVQSRDRIRSTRRRGDGAFLRIRAFFSLRRRGKLWPLCPKARYTLQEDECCLAVTLRKAADVRSRDKRLQGNTRPTRIGRRRQARAEDTCGPSARHAITTQ